jgi:hypothetical protein
VVLNQSLYNRLKAVSGEVRVSHKGRAAKPAKTFSHGKWGWHLNRFGETYLICCPFCKDTRFRCNVNHRYGIGFPELADVEGKFWFAWHCFNESCHEDPANQEGLRTKVYRDIGRDVQRATIIRQGSSQEDVPTVRDWPGTCVSLRDLAPDHLARQYLQGRGFDPDELADRYDLKFCLAVESNYLYLANDRIIIPIYRDEKLFGWQARYVGDIDFKAARIPKYFTCPGTMTSALLYNQDNAKRFQSVVITEGVSDVWAVGESAVAIFGKSLNYRQCGLITRGWRDGFAVVLLDADTLDESAHMVEELRRGMAQGAITVTLPSGTDPGSMDRNVLRELIEETCISAGLDPNLLTERIAQ